MNTKRVLFLLMGFSALWWRCGLNPVEAEMEDEVTVEIRGKGFEPSVITIGLGTKVIWINRDDQPHSVDPGAFMNPTNDFLATRTLDSGQSSDPITFNKVGTINYYCSIHQGPVKQGSIVVRSGSY